MNTGKALYQWDKGRDWTFIDHDEEWIMDGCGVRDVDEALTRINMTDPDENFHKWRPFSSEDGETYTFKLPEAFFK